MSNEKITYLVTNYNNASYVGECISSIVNQLDPNWECIIVDDCSSDDSMDVIQQYSSENKKIRIVRNAKNIGQVKSILNLLGMVDTDIVANVDSDDAIHPETTGYVLNAYKDSPRVGLVYTNCIEYDKTLSVPVSIGQAEKVPFGVTSSIVFGRISSLKSFRMRFYNMTDGYDPELKYAEDMDLMYKLEEVCLPYFINKFLYKYRCLEGSMSRDATHYVEMLDNHKFAKLNALNRRGVGGLMYLLCYLYINFEFMAALEKVKDNKYRKKMYQSLMRSLKLLLDNICYKSIKIK